MNKFCIVICLAVLGTVLAPGRSEAEKVILKSGKVMEGEIIERTAEHVRIKTGKVTYQVPWDMIDENASFPAVDAASGPTGRTAGDWQAWATEHQTYLEKANYIRKQFSRTLADAVWEVNQALSTENFRRIQQISGYTTNKVAFQIKQLGELDPPPELEEYHRKLQEALGLTLKFVDSLALSDRQNYYRYSRRAYDNLIVSLSSLRDAHQRQGAPPDEVSKYTEIIRETQKTFEKRF